eukprot:TRINITY_DN21484_c0_g1_i3.p1 TRINITY_DN21484_c0_g1~~TRINITY_DN21484_c0_g1_i3.p1  ORF type:complete len:267 (+),score=29.49 TRINITY_DN21484_c0_g1_i3:190-990(+)
MKDLCFSWVTECPERTCKRCSTCREIFFNLPLEVKKSIQMAGFRGYQKVGENVTQNKKDAHEAMDFYSESQEATGELLRYKNQWPDDSVLPEYRPTLEKYIAHLLTTGECVMSAIGRGLGESHDFFDSTMTDPYWTLRSICYPPKADLDPSLDLDMGCGAHTDYGYLTFLLTDGTPDTLQVRSLSDTWLTVNDVPPDAFIINIGDMLSLATNKVYKATLHRVKSASTQRISVPFFYEPNFNAVVAGSDGTSTKYGDHLFSKLATNF